MDPKADGTVRIWWRPRDPRGIIDAGNFFWASATRKNVQKKSVIRGWIFLSGSVKEAAARRVTEKGGYGRFRSCYAVGVNDELVTTPHTAGDPETAVDNLGVALVGGLDGGEHAEAVASGVDLLGGVQGGEEGVEDVAGAGEGAAGAHFEDCWSVVGGLHDEYTLDYANRPEATGLAEIVTSRENLSVTERSRPGP